MTKIAFPTDDGQTISKHMGQAPYFQVITVEDGQVQSSEQRAKTSHAHHDHSHEQGVEVAHPGQQMLEAIRDCQVLIAGGMGQPMYDRLVAGGFQVFLTGVNAIDEALQSFEQGNLTTDLRRVHQH